jgi:hypothetical protein
VDALVFKDEQILKSFESTTMQFEKTLTKVTDLTERLVEANESTTNKLIEALTFRRFDESGSLEGELDGIVAKIDDSALAERLMLSEGSL